MIEKLLRKGVITTSELREYGSAVDNFLQEVAPLRGTEGETLFKAVALVIVVKFGVTEGYLDIVMHIVEMLTICKNLEHDKSIDGLSNFIMNWGELHSFDSSITQILMDVSIDICL